MLPFAAGPPDAISFEISYYVPKGELMGQKVIEHQYSGSLYDQVIPVERSALNQYAVQPSTILRAISE